MLRSAVMLAVLLAMIPIASPTPATANDAVSGGRARELFVYFGTYTRGKSKGIYRARLDLATGKLSDAELAAELASPSFLTVHPNGRFLYAVNEIGRYKGRPSGGLTAFALDPATGKLKQLNQQPSRGGGPCHVSVDPSGRCVLAANYGGGSVVAATIKRDGSLSEPTDFVQHVGSSVNPSRQQAPHAHSINVDPTGRFAVAADLGLDKILIYRLDPQTGKITPNDPPFAKTPSGGGPRHFAFHPSTKFAYTNNEILSSVTAFRFNKQTGELKTLHTISTLPKPVKGNSTAEIQVHPSGKFVYCSNRGHDSIAMFSVDAKTGKLTAIGHEKTRGRTPRNFGIDPTGRYLLAANQSTNNVTVFEIDAKSGKLRYTGHQIEVPVPVCVKFVAPAR